MTSDLFHAIDQERKVRHSEWKVKNMKLLSESGLAFRLTGGETLLFREPGKPLVDFYPSTGRWKSQGRMYSGGAGKFISWYKKQGTL